MSELTITLPDGRTQLHRLTTGAATVGRDVACEIAIDDPSASRRHARFMPTPRGILLEDLGSKNGTLVNDAPCNSATLRDGDRVLLGSTLIVYRDSPNLSTTSVVLADDAVTKHSTRYHGREQKLLLSQKRLETIYDLSGRLTTLQNQDTLLHEAMNICCEMLHFERSAIGIRRRNQKLVDWPVVLNLRGAQGEIIISRSLLSRALEHGERAIFTDAKNASFDPTVSMVTQGIRCAMCVPLLQGDEVLGVIYGDRTTTSTAYTDEDIDFFAAIARQVSIGLINARLMDDQRQMIRLNRDLDLARTIQARLFPETLPNRSGLKVAALNDPGQRVSGDYYDVVELLDGRVWFLIADVTGEGIPAAIQMAHFQAAVRVTIAESDDPSILLKKWNEFVCRSTQSGRFITCLLALWNPLDQSLRIAGAGHLPPFLIYADKRAPAEIQFEPGFPLGVDPGATYETSVVALHSPALLFMYTDGVTEALDSQGTHFGLPQLTAALGELNDLSPAAMIKQIRKRVSTFAQTREQSDDITLLAAAIN